MKCLKRYSEVTTTGTPSVTFQSDGSNLIDYTIYGASGSTNILPQQTDASVWDTVGYIKDDGGIREDQNYRSTTFLDAAEGTLSFTNTSPDSSWYRFAWYDENQTWLSETSGYSDTVTVTPPASAVYMRISINAASDVSFVTAGSAGVGDADGNKYAIPLTINNRTYAIYLDAPLGENDSISLSDTGINIPTVDGENTITVDTTVTPSSFTVTSKAWTPIHPKRFDGTNWVDTPLRRCVGYSTRPVWIITDDATKHCYGYHIDGATGDVTYIPGTDNENYTPAAMGSTTFDYGDWPQDAFFIPRPCMVKYDGTVDYFLDPSDYSKKLDGTASDVADLTYGGNCMMQFSVIYHASITTADDGSVDEYFANYKVDDRFECYCNYDAENNLIPYFYVSAFNGCTYDGKMRSISGLKLTPWATTAYSSTATYNVGDRRNYDGKAWVCIEAITEPEAFDSSKWEQYAFNGQTTGQEEIAQARANNTTATDEWYTYLVADHDLLAKLATLICKHLNHQTKFGRGIDSGYQTAKEAYISGTLNDKGLFYGSTANGTTAVKIFGIENFYACTWKRAAGLIGTSTGYVYKLTHGTKDGSTATSFNTNGAGYKTITRTKHGSGYVTTMHFEPDGFWIPATVGTNRYAVYYWNGNGYVLLGGASYVGAACGSWDVGLLNGVGDRLWGISSALSLKPRAVASE